MLSSSSFSTVSGTEARWGKRNGKVVYHYLTTNRPLATISTIYSSKHSKPPLNILLKSPRTRYYCWNDFDTNINYNDPNVSFNNICLVCLTWFLPAAWKSAAVLSVSSMDSRYSWSASCTRPSILEVARLQAAHKLLQKDLHEQNGHTWHTENLSLISPAVLRSLKQSECVQHWPPKYSCSTNCTLLVILSQTFCHVTGRRALTHRQTCQNRTDYTNHLQKNFQSYQQPGSLKLKSDMCPSIDSRYTTSSA